MWLTSLFSDDSETLWYRGIRFSGFENIQTNPLVGLKALLVLVLQSLLLCSEELCFSISDKDKAKMNLFVEDFLLLIQERLYKVGAYFELKIVVILLNSTMQTKSEKRGCRRFMHATILICVTDRVVGSQQFACRL